MGFSTRSAQPLGSPARTWHVCGRRGGGGRRGARGAVQARRRAARLASRSARRVPAAAHRRASPLRTESRAPGTPAPARRESGLPPTQQSMRAAATCGCCAGRARDQLVVAQGRASLPRGGSSGLAVAAAASASASVESASGGHGLPSSAGAISSAIPSVTACSAHLLRSFLACVVCRFGGFNSSPSAAAVPEQAAVPSKLQPAMGTQETK